MFSAESDYASEAGHSDAENNASSADYALDSDMVDGKHAHELIQGLYHAK